MKKLREDRTWKDAHPVFTCNLWHSRCMKECFTMTAHWIEIGGSPLAHRWELQHRVLGSYLMQDATVGHQSACTLCMPLSQAEFPLSLGRCLICCIVVCIQSLLGLFWSNAICSNCMWISLLLLPIVGAKFPRLPIPTFNGICFVVDAISYTMSWRRG